MITLRKAEDRQHDRRGKHEAWHTFYRQERANPLANGFGSLGSLNEHRLAPGAAVARHPHLHPEIVTYIHEGAILYEDSMGRSGVIRAGEAQRMTPGSGIRHSEKNASRTDWAHFFHVWLRPPRTGIEPSHEQKRFYAAERRGVLCPIASPDARKGSLRIHQDALVYSAMLHPGQHMVHELSHGRSAWLHLVLGVVTLSDIVLIAGDGAGITAERAVSFTAGEETEILLFDLGDQRPRSPSNAGVS